MASIYHNLTVSTRLDRRTSPELMDYLQTWRTEYARISRYTWYHYASVFPRPKKAAFNTELQKTFGITKRTANSIIYDMSGRYNALVELKKKERGQLVIKISSMDEAVKALKQEVARNASLAAGNQLTAEQLEGYRRDKRSLFYKQQKRNKMKNQLEQLEKDIQARRFRICFGSRKRLDAQNRLAENGYGSRQAWYKDFVQHRDCTVFYLGAKDETWGNQMLQLTPQGNGLYRIQCRKDGTCVTGKDGRYVYGTCRFSYMDDRLDTQLAGKEKGITYRIRFSGKKVYLQAVLSLPVEQVPTTSLYDGAIGLDYNDGFIQMAQTDRHGNLTGERRFALVYHGTGKKAQDEIRQKVARISSLALETGKSIVCEDLDFVKKKSAQCKANSRKGKNYHRMTHLFDYSRYKETLRNAAVRNGIGLVMVNPAYTSQIARKKYCGNRKLNIHTGAAYVIARRGQGFKDRMIL